MMQRFVKMHGLGNDFVVFDVRENVFILQADQARALSDRRTGVGCDQIIFIRNSDVADAFMGIQNADGSDAEACGNATRCVALLLTQGKDARVTIATEAGVLGCEVEAGLVSVDLGVPKLDWDEIPLAEERNTLRVKLGMGSLPEGIAVNVGNPHVIFFPEAGASLNITELGPKIEYHELFPEQVNVSFAEIKSRQRMALKVWERGTGVTKACGTAAAAAVVAAGRIGRADRSVKVEMLGGDLEIEWRPDDHVILRGPTALSFEGQLDLESLGSLSR
jgi:diaminopimelate epimerase